ncbi:rRNA processing/ribosome biogenesis-domain-containing protein [Lasiosphaeria miniovina]|uniref:Pre-rRNA-processing protein RIX1 n=1 Tax=Lasiosphaeria miniovina TaxID=1954250 RepID=A0AA40A4J7_9PEZI|nr:rRNA processing/ribosome biogenesis-domain-containing protein [Lasiosphaeria miniovina]KAK0709135.1 rRNA processing/ribosome biogenesis-domain-containing protein [Lasiosphaeria miniovina]
MSVPTDLRVLCRRLASTPADDLPRFCPVLVSHVLRCGEPLSAAQEAKGKDKTSEAPVLVHRLKTHITTLLTGKSPAGRFAAVCLIKAVIDVGGWETLKASDPWIRGLISVLQKPDPLASKELCIVTLTRIYMLLQDYPTLVREMATPTLPSFITACLQLVKPPASGKPLRISAAVAETIASALSKLIVLYPTTMRPFRAQIIAIFSAYVAPTCSDPLVAPQTLKESARRLLILLHCTAPKDGSGEDWIRAMRLSVKSCHATADQVFRAVHESWESSTGYISQPVRTDLEPCGGGVSADEFPSWTGLQAGAERLVGLLEFLAEHFRTPTKSAVAVSLGELLDLTSRITLITPPGSDDAVELNASIGRDEKAELWSVLRDIHAAVMRLHAAIVQRLGDGALPLATDILDQIARIFKSSRNVRSVREATYTLAKEVLLLSGPMLPRLTVDSAAPVIQSCCQDLLRAAGHSEDKPQVAAPASAPTSTTSSNSNSNGSKKGSNGRPHPQQNVTGNADAFLGPPSGTTNPTATPSPFSTSSSPDHGDATAAAAAALLPLLLSHLPQRHLSPEARGLVDRTAILAGSRPAMLASCLHPYKDSRGRHYASILPFLVGQFPRDQAVEVLRTNLLRAGAGATASNATPYATAGAWADDNDDNDMHDEDEDAAAAAAAGKPDDASMANGDGEDAAEKETAATAAEATPKTSGFGGWAPSTDAAAVAAAGIDANGNGNADMDVDSAIIAPLSPLKRKSDGAGRLGTAAKKQQRAKPAPTAEAEDDGSGSDNDDGSESSSVQIDMTIDDDDEEEEEEEEEEGGEE